jgi:transposase
VIPGGLIVPKSSPLSVGERSAFVLRLIAKEDSAANLAREAGVSEATIYRWRDEFLEGGKARLKGKDAVSKAAEEVTKLKRAIAKRDQVIGELTIANRILKKLEASDL